MANRYWVGGNGTWDSTDTTHWATTSGGAGGASVPTSSDNVIFDANSHNAAYTVTATSSNITKCANLTIGNPSSGAITITGGTGVYGNISIAASCVTSNYSITCYATSGSFTIGIIPPIYQFLFADSCAATYTLTAILYSVFFTIDANSTVTFNSANYNISYVAGKDNYFFRCYSNAATLNLGTSSLIIGEYGINAVIMIASGATADVDAVDIKNKSTSDILENITLDVNGHTFRDLLANANAMYIKTSITIRNWTLSESVFQVAMDGDLTVTGTLKITMSQNNTPPLFFSNVAGTQRTITSAANDINAFACKDIKGAGEANWDFSNITYGSSDGGGNSGITFSTARTLYWVGGTGNWSYNDKTHWSLTSGGNGGETPPRLQDDVIFDENSVTSASQTITLLLAWAHNIDFSDIANSPTITINDATWYFIGSIVTGNITCSNTMTLSNYGLLNFLPSENVTIDFSGVNLPSVGSSLTTSIFTHKKVTFASDFNTRYLGFLQGEIYLDDITLKVGDINQNLGSRIWRCERSASRKKWTLNSGTLSIQGGMGYHTYFEGYIDAGTSTVIIGDGFSYNGDCYISCYNLHPSIAGQNTFYNLESKLTKGTYTIFIQLAQSTTAKIHNIKINKGCELGIHYDSRTCFEVANLDINGEENNLCYIKGNNYLTLFSIIDYIGPRIKTPYSSWTNIHIIEKRKIYAGKNSIDGGNNTNIYFTNPNDAGLLLNIN